jgi:hypothetical protein
MKKLLSMGVAMALMLGIVGQAVAYFDPFGDALVQVVYKEGDVQVAYDLGSAASLTTGAMMKPAGSIALSDFAAPVDWADLRIGYYAANNIAPSGDVYFATTGSSAPSVKGTYYGPFMNMAFGLNSSLQSFGSAKVKTSITDPAGYGMKMNQNSNIPGHYAGFNADWEDGEASLAELASGGYVDMYLWHFTSGGEGKAVFEGCVGTLTVSADGSTTFKPVPLPASVLLLGSGVLGLIGMRRKIR